MLVVLTQVPWYGPCRRKNDNDNDSPSCSDIYENMLGERDHHLAPRRGGWDGERLCAEASPMVMTCITEGETNRKLANESFVHPFEDKLSR